MRRSEAFLTNLNGWHLVAGKLIAMALPAVHCLLAVLPVLGISFFIGGVTAGEFLRVALLLAETLFLTTAIGLAASAFFEDGRKALAVSVGCVAGLCLALPAMIWFAGWRAYTVLRLFLLMSPGFALNMTKEANYATAPGRFWISLVLIQAVSWSCIGLAGWLLTRSWQDKPMGKAKKSWLADLLEPKVDPAVRKARREKLLAGNPIVWLGDRSGRSNAAIWLFVIGALLFWMAGVSNPTAPWFAGEAVFVMVYCLHALIKVWVGWEASRRLAEDRNAGVLELLLCTPLKDEWVWQGWLSYLRRRFVGPIAALLLIDLSLLIVGVSSGRWARTDGSMMVSFVAGMGLFVADAYALCWVGLWQGIRGRTPMQACLNTMLYVLVLPAAGCMGFLGLMNLVSTGVGMPLGAMTALWFTVGYISDAALSARAMVRLSGEFRTSAIYGVDSEVKKAPPANDDWDGNWAVGKTV